MLAISKKEPSQMLPVSRPATVHDEVLTTLQLHAPLTVEELVRALPQFRWIDVLQVVSELWGEGRLTIADHGGCVKVWLIIEGISSEPGVKMKREESSQYTELTAL